jgi:multidrug efflux pump subunit AcrB
MKKNTIIFFALAFLSVSSFSLAKADTGKIIPDEFLWLLVISFLAILIFAIIFTSTLIKLLFLKKQKKEPRNLILIILLSILTPFIWLYAEANFHLLYNIESKYDYRIKEVFNYGITFLAAVFGMILGFIIKKIIP